MAVARRVTPPAPPSGGSVNFGGDGFFTGGGLGLPEGDYAVTFHTQMYQPTKQDGTPSKTPAFLAVVGTFYPIDRSGTRIGEPEEHPFGCGSKAHESFLPSPNGKGFVAVPGGKGNGMWSLSNFGIFFDSLKNAGLPPGLVTSSFEPMDGIWVHTRNIPEPEEKRAATLKARSKSKTGMAGMMSNNQQADDDRGPGICVVVDEILEGGRPWDGSGGIPDEQAAAPKTPPAPKGRGAATKPPATPPPAADATDEETVGNAALDAVSTVLGAKPGGLTKLALKTEAFTACKKAAGDDVAQAVMEGYLQDDATLAAVLEQLGYKLAGLMVKPA